MKQIDIKEVQELKRLSGKGDQLWTVQDIKFDHADKLYMSKPKPILENV